jgi:hypothetical protein
MWKTEEALDRFLNDIIVGPNSLGSYLGVLRAVFSRCVSHGLSEYRRDHEKQERYDYGSHRDFLLFPFPVWHNRVPESVMTATLDHLLERMNFGGAMYFRLRFDVSVDLTPLKWPRCRVRYRR